MATAYQPGVRVSEYVLEHQLGMGSFSEVWQARHHVWEDERVAVKLPIEPEYVRYIQHEGILVHGLRHPNIVRVMGLDPFAEIPYLVMELVRGPSLRQLIDEHPDGLPIPGALAILRGLLAALAAAHANNVLHRDLKPSNVLLDLESTSLAEISPERVKVSDFGLGVRDADTLRSIVQSVSMERESKVVGTLAYLAPELRDNRSDADARTDLYAVGIILFEMLTGERPAGAELPSTVRSDTPQWLDDVFRRLYARRESRFESADAVVEELRKHHTDAPLRGVVPPVPPIPRSSGARRSCRNCGHAAHPDDQFCTQCGDQIAARIRRCPRCQAFPGASDRFCIHCGAALGSEVA